MRNLGRVFSAIAVLLVLASLSYSQKTWVGVTGGGDGSSWSDPLNWSGGAAPISTDQVVLDNSTVAGSYSVLLPTGATKTTITRLTITPGVSNTITLTLPSGNTYGATNDAALVVGDATGATDDIILNNGAVLVNSSGGSAGNGIQVDLSGGIARINNGGRYVHSTSRSTAGIVPLLSTASGTETGIYEYDVPGTGSFSASASGRNYGSLVLSRTAGAATYSASGGSALTVRGNFVLNSGITFTSTMTGALNLAGNLTHNGVTLTIPSGQAVTLNGSSGQTISGSAAVTFGGALTLNNNSGVTVSTNLTVNGTLTLTSGKITLGSGVTMTIPGASTITGASTSNYIVADVAQGSTLRRSAVGASNVLFPIGLASSYNPVTINNAGTAADYIVGVQSGFDVAPPSAAACVNRQWNITEASGGPSNSSLTFQWNTADENGSFNRTGSLVIGTYTSSWADAAASYTDLGGGVYTANASGYSAFNPFAVGNAGALPVQLASLSARSNRRSAEVSWSTMTEVGCYGFEVERKTVSGQQSAVSDWVKVGFVQGAGTSTLPRAYGFTDDAVEPGRYAYRIKQIDNNGSFHYYGNSEVEIGLVGREFRLESAYPNPFNPSTNIEFALGEDGPVTLKIFNVLGQEVAELFHGTAEAGKLYKTRFDASQLPTGVYFAKLDGGRQQSVKKLLFTK